MKSDRYVNVRIHRELASRLDEVMVRLGYRSRDEVVEDAVHRFVDALVP